MDGEDFSLPATADTLPHFIDSPPLWQAPSAPNSLSRHDEDIVSKEQEGEGSVGAKHGPRKGRGSLSLSEERMDMLWEDFNEPPLSPPVPRLNGCNSEKEMAGSRCMKMWSISKAKTDKPGVMALLKVLRKPFSIHHNRRSLRKGQPLHW